MAEFLNGWGRGTWGQLAYGQASIPLEITAPSAGTAGTPVAAVNAQAIVSVSGVTASLGSLSVVIQADANAPASSVLAAGGLNFENSFKLSILTITNTVNSSLYGLENINFLNLLTSSKLAIILFMVLGKIELLSLFLIIKKAISRN